jgi:predicted DNA-binding protein (MmcQ/YjbR family)
MRMSIIKMIVVLFSYALMFIQSSDAYDNVYTHPYINEKAVKEHSKVNRILKESVGLNEGIDAIYLDKEIWRWIRDGGKEEDEPEWRCLRHFHDPLSSSWDDAGLLSLYKKGPGGQWCLYCPCRCLYPCCQRANPTIYKRYWISFSQNSSGRR